MEILHGNDLLLIAALVSAWWFGFVAGKWWERLKNEEMPDNDEGMW